MADLERLKKKYGPRLEDVSGFRVRIDAELNELADTGERLRELTEAEATARESYLSTARQLTTRRQNAAMALSGQLVPVLGDLAIPEARFEMRFNPDPLPEEHWSETGVDAGEFYFSANPGEALRPLAKVASGGELSRVMLGIKTLASTDELGKTLVFDEVGRRNRWGSR